MSQGGRLAQRIDGELVREVMERVRRREFSFSITDKRFISFLADRLGATEQEVVKEYSQIAAAINALRAPRAARARGEAEGYRLSRNWLANVIYFLVSESSTEEPPSVTTYKIIEPIMVAALAGDAGAREKARLLFMRVSESNLDKVVSLLTDIMHGHRDVFCSVEKSKYYVLCSVTRWLASPSSTAGAPPFLNPICVEMVDRAYSEVCGGVGSS